MIGVIELTLSAAIARLFYVIASTITDPRSKHFLPVAAIRDLEGQTALLADVGKSQGGTSNGQLSFTSSIKNSYNFDGATAPSGYILDPDARDKLVFEFTGSRDNSHENVRHYQFVFPEESGFPKAGSHENSTVKQDREDDIIQDVRNLFVRGRDESFQDGMESEFSRELVVLFRKNWTDTSLAIASLIEHADPFQEVLSEALRWIGRINDLASHPMRRWLLERALYSGSVRVRDGALLGISALNDKHAIRHLREVASRERFNDLREDMEHVILELENTG